MYPMIPLYPTISIGTQQERPLKRLLEPVASVTQLAHDVLLNDCELSTGPVLVWRLYTFYHLIFTIPFTWV